MLPTLEEFIAHMGERPWSVYVKHPGFSSLYVRRGPCFIEGEYHNGILTIANVTARKQNKGSFRKLVDYIQSRGLSIYVECVQVDDFVLKLEHMGFKRVNHHSGNHYYLEKQ